MQVKIMMLLSDEKNKKLCQCAEAVLNEVAGAFEHSFSVLYEKIGVLSQNAYEAPLTEEAVEACLKCQGILLDCAETEGFEELLDALDATLHARYCGIPQALCGRHERGFSLWMGIVRSLDDAKVSHAVKQAFELGVQQEVLLSYVRPNGKFSEHWLAEMSACALQYPNCPAKEMLSTEAMEKLIETPSQIGLLLAPPYAGAIYRAAAVTLDTVPYLMRDIALGEGIGVYAPTVAQSKMEENNPVPMILALADLLRFSAGLSHEADCVEAAVQNVLEAGWRTPDMGQLSDMTITATDMTDLVCEQIGLAGRLMYHQGEELA